MINEVHDGGITTPLGFTASSALADVKGKGRKTPDVALLKSDEPCVAAALFTKNIVAAAPVVYDRELLKTNSDKIYAVIANAGNANACTGMHGLSVCGKITEAAAKAVGVDKKSVLIASTGVIGIQLPHEKITSVIPQLAENLSDEGGGDFAKAIMTTDTFSKEAAVMVETPKGCAVIGGACKGAGMIAPSVATMLTFITTDAKISKELLDKALKEAADESFNCVTVDGDMSTNDTVVVLANGMSGVTIDKDTYAAFLEGLKYVCRTLAMKMVKDGEGATKLVTVSVKNARTKEEARACAAKIANSPLVKTMFAGCDPNWGRLMASAGASGAVFVPDKTDIFFNNIHYVANGMIIDYALEEKVYGIMKTPEYEITLDLHAGKESATFYTCDFTVDYVKINADYRS